MKNYDRQQPPKSLNATKVEIGLYVNNFHSLNEQKMDYSIDFYLRQSWNDPRLKFTPKNFVKMIRPKASDIDKLWLPDTFFRNEKAGKTHDITVPNRLLRIYSNGDVWFATRITATFSCPLHLQKFPFDTQVCSLMVESYGYTMDTMTYGWMGAGLAMDASVDHLPQFIIQDTQLSDCSVHYATGAYPCLKVDFKLQRIQGYYILQVFIPSILIVIVSWFGFWMNDAVTARVFLGLMTLLTMTTQTSSIRSMLPRVSYVKAIDVWMLLNMLYVFMALLETAIVTFLSKRAKTAHSNTEMIPLSPTNKDESENGNGMSKVAMKIDFISRILFPVSFLLYVIIYFSIYA
ncbi:glycine receptor subunit alpha-2-like isoform X2 [Tubulanus polymorphus]